MISFLFRPVGVWAVVAAAIYYTLLVALSSIPGPDLPEAEVPGLDKVVHGVVYAGLGWYLAGSRWPVAVVLVVGWMAGAADELYQLWIPGRQASWWDGLADAVGVVAGAWARWSWEQRGGGA